MAYSDKVIDHYNNPRNVGALPKEDPAVGTGLVGAPECGDVMKLQIKVNEETEVIEDARFKTFGCGSAIASSTKLAPSVPISIRYAPNTVVLSLVLSVSIVALTEPALRCCH